MKLKCTNLVGKERGVFSSCVFHLRAGEKGERGGGREKRSPWHARAISLSPSSSFRHPPCNARISPLPEKKTEIFIKSTRFHTPAHGESAKNEVLHVAIGESLPSVSAPLMAFCVPPTQPTHPNACGIPSSSQKKAKKEEEEEQDRHPVLALSLSSFFSGSKPFPPLPPLPPIKGKEEIKTEREGTFLHFFSGRQQVVSLLLSHFFIYSVHPTTTRPNPTLPPLRFALGPIAPAIPGMPRLEFAE